MSDFDVHFTIDGVNLQDPAGRWELARATKRRALPAVRATNITTPNRHGNHFVPNDTFGPGSMSFVLMVTDLDSAGTNQGPAQAEANLELATALFLHTGRQFTIEHHLDPTQKRTATGRVTAGSDPEALDFDLTLYRLTFVVEIPGVFWTDGTGAQVAEGAATTSAGALHLPAFNGGSAPITDAVVRVRGPFNGKAAVTDTQSGTGLSWQGTLPANTYLYLNAANLKAHTSTSATAWTSGTDVSAGLDYPPAGPLQLIPVVTPEGATHTLRYALAYSLPAANPSLNALAVRAERKFL